MEEPVKEEVVDESKKIEKKDNSQKKLIIVIVLLLLVIASMGVYIAYEKGVIFTNTEIKDNKSNNKANINKNNDKKKDADDENTTANDVEKPLDLSKCLNNNGTYSNQTDVAGDYGLSMTINQDKKSATLSIDWSKFGPLSTASSYSSSVEQYQITGFSKNINTTFVGDVGQDSMGITLFYLMEDGTVEYTPMFVIKTDTKGNTYFDMNKAYDVSANGTMSNGHFVTKGQLTGVEKVIKLYSTDFSIPNGSGGKTTIGATKDGSFYDLGTLITK